MKRIGLFLLSISIMIGYAGAVYAEPILYTTSTDTTSSNFLAYNPSTNSWGQKASINTCLQLTADKNGNVYAYDRISNEVKQYDPVTDTWANYLSGPNGWSSDNRGNLFVLNDGRVIMTKSTTSNLYLYDSGTWSTVNLGFSTNRVGDYDPENNQLVLGEYNSSNGHLLDLTTFSSTLFTGGPANGEWARFGEIANGHYYFKSGQWLADWDLSNNSLSPANLGTSQDNFYTSGAIDRDNDILYIVGLGGGHNSLTAFDLINGGYTNLANSPGTTLGYHSTAVVGGVSVVPVPSAILLSTIGLGLAGRKLRKRQTT